MQRSIAALALSSVAALCACSPKEAAKPDSSKVAQSGAPANAGSYDPATHTATVKATEFAFAAPDTIQAGWTTFHLMNEGTTLHHLAIVRIDSGKTMADVGAAMQTQGPPPKWIVEVGGPAGRARAHAHVPAPARLGEVVVVGGNPIHRGLGHAALRGRSAAVVVGDVTVVVDRLLEHIQRRGSPVASAAPDQQFDHVLRHHAAQ